MKKVALLVALVFFIEGCGGGERVDGLSLHAFSLQPGCYVGRAVGEQSMEDSSVVSEAARTLVDYAANSRAQVVQPIAQAVRADPEQVRWEILELPEAIFGQVWLTERHSRGGRIGLQISRNAVVDAPIEQRPEPWLEGEGRFDERESRIELAGIVRWTNNAVAIYRERNGEREWLLQRGCDPDQQVSWERQMVSDFRWALSCWDATLRDVPCEGVDVFPQD